LFIHLESILHYILKDFRLELLRILKSLGDIYQTLINN